MARPQLGICTTISNMQPNRYSYLVLSPSLFSVTLSIFIGIVVLGAANWSYVLHDILFYDYFFGPDGVITAMTSPGSGDTLIKTVFSQSFFNNTVVIAVSLGIGILFYLLLEGIHHLRNPLPPLPRREARQHESRHAAADVRPQRGDVDVVG